MKIGILTSSRADFGIYIPLLNKLKEDIIFDVEVIAFGTHLSHIHGYTLNEIEKKDDFKIHKIISILSNDSEEAIATSYGLTVLKFSQFWNDNKFDCVFCIGDRFEMSAAVQAGIPFGVFFAHIGGGETTLGAIDETYRHQITHASSLHFASTNIYSEKIFNMTGDLKNIHTIGSVSLDNIGDYKPINEKDFFLKYHIPIKEYALVTFHPETVDSQNNISHVNEMSDALRKTLSFLNLVITMPNADTLGSLYREKLNEIGDEFPEKVVLIENFGRENYFSAMYYSQILIGNTSSGIVEAASFGKYVVNVGDRQKGRAQSDNVLNAKFKSEDILVKIKKAIESRYKGDNIYYQKGAVDTIIKIIKKYEKL